MSKIPTKGLPTVTHPSDVGTYNPTDLYGDVLTVLMARYENNLKDKYNELNDQLRVAQDARGAFVTEFSKSLIKDAEKCCGTFINGDVKTTVAFYTSRDNTPSEVSYEWKKRLAAVNFMVEVSANSDELYELVKDQYKTRDEFEYWVQGTARSSIKKSYIIPEDVAAEFKKLDDLAKATVEERYEIESLQVKLPSKERQIRAAIAEKKLEAFGLSDMLQDPQLASMVSLDADLTKLVTLK